MAPTFARHERYARNIVLWSMSNCLQITELDAVPFASHYSRNRLRKHAWKFGHLLAIQSTLFQWDQFFTALAGLGITLSQGIYSEGATKSAVKLMFCILGDEGFRIDSRLPINRVVRSLERGVEKAEIESLVIRMRKAFNRPQ